MNKLWFLMALVFPVTASATGVSFSYEIGIGVFALFSAIVFGVVLILRVVARTRKDCLSQTEQASKSNPDHSKS